MDKDKQKTLGAYYTPKIVVDYMCENTIIPALFNKIKDNCDKQNVVIDIDKYTKDNNIKALIEDHNDNNDVIYCIIMSLLTLRILEPSCGDGNFLLGCIDLLQTIYEQALTISMKKNMIIFGNINDDIKLYPNLKFYIIYRILQNNLYAIDIDIDALEICKKRLVDRLLEETENKDNAILPDLNDRIRCGDTLLDFNKPKESPKEEQFELI